jgi:hypothetical protein
MAWSAQGPTWRWKVDPRNLVAVILALQFAVFGWRISREIQLEEQGRKTWLLVADYVNFLIMLGLVALCIILPLASGTFGKASVAFLAASAVFVVFYPIILAGHYRLFSRLGRSIYRGRKDVPYVTDQEAWLLAVSLLCSGLAAFLVAR